jgi:hypothetical protein
MLVGGYALVVCVTATAGIPLAATAERWRLRRREHAAELRLARSVYADQDWRWAAQFDWDSDPEWSTQFGTDDA